MSTQSKQSMKMTKQLIIPALHGTGLLEYRSEFDDIESLLNSNNHIKEKKIAFYEKLAQRIEIIEKLFSVEVNNSRMLTAHIMYALLTENPIHTLDEIIKYRKYVATRNKINSAASKFFEGNMLVTDIVISNLITSNRNL